MNTLTCETCTETAADIQAAIAHVTDYPAHVMNGESDDEGTTVTVSINEDAYDDDDDDDYRWEEE